MDEVHPKSDEWKTKTLGEWGKAAGLGVQASGLSVSRLITCSLSQDLAWDDMRIHKTPGHQEVWIELSSALPEIWRARYVMGVMAYVLFDVVAKHTILSAPWRLLTYQELWSIESTPSMVSP